MEERELTFEEHIALAKGREMCAIAINDNERLVLTFVDGSRLVIWDNGQNCCESRTMSTDDELEHYSKLVFMGCELRRGGSINDEGDYHETEFLYVHTSLGPFTVVNHNRHNGYYGGFGIAACFEPNP